MAEITVGQYPPLYGVYREAGITYIDISSPMTAKGVINTIQVVARDAFNIKIALFSNNEPSFARRNMINAGYTIVNKTQTFTGCALEGEEGDSIGFYGAGRARFSKVPAPAYMYQITGDYTESDGFTANILNFYIPNIGGIGESVEVGSKAFIHYYRHLMAGGVGRQC